MNVLYLEQELEERFTWVSWREPLPMRIGHREGFGCRYCIAIHGYGPGSYPGFDEDRLLVEKHIKENHLSEDAPNGQKQTNEEESRNEEGKDKAAIKQEKKI